MSNGKRNDFNLILLGGPGAGKGTQASKIVESMDLAHLSTGDILREEVSEGTDLGLEAREYMDRGDLVPDELIIEMVRKHLDRESGYLFDGFPRTISQAEALENVLEVDKVIYINISKEEAVRRLSARRVCSECGEIYNLQFDKPDEPGVCDKCNGELYQRSDDKPEVIRNRFETFLEQSAPLVGFYRDRGVLVEIDGEREPDAIFENIRAAIS